jgi:hypothetical protein
METLKSPIKTTNGNSYVSSEGDLVLDGLAIEFAEPAMAA